MSTTLSVNTGIGQGTILGPLIFIFYNNDVIASVQNLQVNMYAVPKVQEGLNGFQKWCTDNCLKSNVRKSKTHHKRLLDRVSNCLELIMNIILCSNVIEICHCYLYLPRLRKLNWTKYIL